MCRTAAAVLTALICWAELSSCCPAAEPAPTKYRFAQVHMGVAIEITIFSESEEDAEAGARAAFARIAELDRCLSDYNDDSEAMQLCATAFEKPVVVSADLARALGGALDMAARTDGAVDVTIGPVTKLWRTARRLKRPPEDEKLREALSRVGWRNVQFDPETREVRLARAGMQLDFGACAKGLAVAEARDVLRAAGLPCVMVHAGGDMALGDAPPGSDGWRIAVGRFDDDGRTPPLNQRGESVPQRRASDEDQPAGPAASWAQPPETPRTVLLLQNCCVATSGDLFQYLEFEGKRYSHTIDPQTGWGLTERRMATVITADGLQADALATAAVLLGPEAGLKLLDSLPDTRGLIQVRQGDQTVTHPSARFPR